MAPPRLSTFPCASHTAPMTMMAIRARIFSSEKKSCTVLTVFTL